jgi:hypothetical protein
MGVPDENHGDKTGGNQQSAKNQGRTEEDALENSQFEIRCVHGQDSQT